jgi:hypothetical protein
MVYVLVYSVDGSRFQCVAMRRHILHLLRHRCMPSRQSLECLAAAVAEAEAALLRYSNSCEQMLTAVSRCIRQKRFMMVGST